MNTVRRTSLFRPLRELRLRFGKRARVGRNRTPPSEPPARTYRGVGIQFDETTCCDWVRRLEGRRLLPSQVHLFPLPLPECDAGVCRCSYVHYADRRTGDRRLPFGSTTPSGQYATRNRRMGAERRRSYVAQERRILTELGLDDDGR